MRMEENIIKKHVEMIDDYIIDTESPYGMDYQYNDNHGLLIRCCDCKNSRLSETVVNGKKLYCPTFCGMVADDFFCGFGKNYNGEVAG